MQKNLLLNFKSHDDISDTLSTNASFAQVHSEEDSSPSNGHSSSPPDCDVLEKSKKIRKKRNAYQKIDDDIRLRLLEAVQRGETLKSAAKRYQVNYSSAKSIFHIFRKEGRILKKVTQEKSFDLNLPVGQEIMLPAQFLQNFEPSQTQQRSDFAQLQQPLQPQSFAPERSYNAIEEAVGCSSPFNGLVSNFSEAMKIGGNIKSKDAHIPTHPSRFNPKTNCIDYSAIPKMQNFVSKPSTNPAMRSPAERIRQYDNFYMNYSNSPLSGNAKILREGSESGSNRHLRPEFDSFTDMLSSFNACNVSEPSIPKLRMPVEPIERKGSFEEGMMWGETFETAALDTYKTFVDAQMILSNAFRKASLLNNLVQFQKNGSPRFLSY